MGGTAATNRTAALLLLAMVLPFANGCYQHLPVRPYPMMSPPDVCTPDSPRELQKAILPQYTIEPPDILSINAINIVPKSPYRLRTFDSLLISVTGTLPEAPIVGFYSVQLGGLINLGVDYGSVKVAGLTVEEASKAIEDHLLETLKAPVVSVSLGQIGASQQIAGPHLVAPDGRVTLGSYGAVSVVGLTVDEAKAAIEQHLSSELENPEVSVDVAGYNSKSYYLILQGAGSGDGVFRFPTTGNETVLDAVSQVGGLNAAASAQIWIARPGKNHQGCDQVLQVNWRGITQLGDAHTNFQILPGDRVYISEDPWVAFDNHLAKFTAPLERILGFSTFAVGTVSRFSGRVLQGGGNVNSNF